MLKNNRLWFLTLALFCLILDQISKTFVITNLPVFQKIILIDGVLSLQKTFNTGAAFSLLENSQLFLILLTFIVIVFLVYFGMNQKNRVNAVSLGFLFGGALGNLTDRLLHGYVVDFLQFEFINFPIFNFADIFINIGVIILVINILFDKNEQ